MQMDVIIDSFSNNMKTHIISLEYVRMAIRRNSYLYTTKAMAVSRPYQPMRGRGNDLLYGACVIFPLR